MKDLYPIDWTEQGHYLRSDAIQLDGCDSAVVGITESGELCYSYELLVDVFVARDEMTYDESIEWVEFNIVSLLGYAKFTLIYTDL